MTRPTVFISYSHKDEDWKDRVVTHLRGLGHQGSLAVWDDRRIEGGQDWYQEIQDAMSAASVALLLVSADFLGLGVYPRQGGAAPAGAPGVGGGAGDTRHPQTVRLADDRLAEAAASAS
jgi:hypothetical protein